MAAMGISHIHDRSIYILYRNYVFDSMFWKNGLSFNFILIWGCWVASNQPHAISGLLLMSIDWSPASSSFDSHESWKAACSALRAALSKICDTTSNMVTNNPGPNGPRACKCCYRCTKSQKILNHQKLYDFLMILGVRPFTDNNVFSRLKTSIHAWFTLIHAWFTLACCSKYFKKISYNMFCLRAATLGAHTQMSMYFTHRYEIKPSTHPRLPKPTQIQLTCIVHCLICQTRVVFSTSVLTTGSGIQKTICLDSRAS